MHLIDSRSLELFLAVVRELQRAENAYINGFYDIWIITVFYWCQLVFILCLFIVFGLAALIIGGRLIVVYAVRIAEIIGLQERIIAITIISVGTSLPELATSIVAALKKNVNIAIGNIVGSNIFNIFFILGISACINPITVPTVSNVDLLVNIGAGILLFLCIFTGKGRKLERFEGVFFVMCYICYLLALILL